jgi:hypothetical protein
MKNQGFSLVGVLIAASLLSIISVFGTRLIVQQRMANENVQFVSINQSRILFQKQVLSRNPLGIVRHSSGYLNGTNGQIHCPELRDCITNYRDNPNSCPTTKTPCAFHLGLAKLTGSPSHPLLASLTGKDCEHAVQPSNDCLLSVKGYFRRDGRSLEIWSEVEHIGPDLPNGTRLTSYDGLEEGASVKVSLKSFSFSCPGGKRLANFDSSGNPICEDIFSGSDGNDLASQLNQGFLAALSGATAEGLTSEDFLKQQRDDLQSVLGEGAKLCKADQIMLGLTHDGRPVCRNFPLQWRYNSTLLCTQGGSEDHRPTNCSNVKSSIPECPVNAATQICQEEGSFCGIYVGGGLNASGHRVDLALPILTSQSNLNILRRLEVCCKDPSCMEPVDPIPYVSGCPSPHGDHQLSQCGNGCLTNFDPNAEWYPYCGFKAINMTGTNIKVVRVLRCVHRLR